jgi:hypothetical protein
MPRLSFSTSALEAFMNYSPSEAQVSLQMVEGILKSDDRPPLRLKKLNWALMSLRAHALVNGLRLITGDKVCGGPFKDMALTDDAIMAYRSPILLGCYEHELHSVFEEIIAAKYAQILNIGCSVGYYAVGLARRMPRVVVEAFDIDTSARNKCMNMARINNVENRVHISGQFYGDDFAKYGDKKTLAIVDIEGAEKELLNPEAYPALKSMDVIVELHDLMDASISKIVCDRFAASHTIEIIKNRTSMPDVEKLLPEDYFLDPYDHLLMGWESRDGKTPWGIFRTKNE